MDARRYAGRFYALGTYTRAAARSSEGNARVTGIRELRGTHPHGCRMRRLRVSTLGRALARMRGAPEFAWMGGIAQGA